MKKASSTRTRRVTAHHHATKARRATVGRSSALVDELRNGLGETRFSAILKLIRHEVGPALRIRDAEEKEIARMRSDNVARLEAKRAAILANAVSSDEAGVFISRTRPIVNRLAKTGELLAVQDGRYLRFPRWQFDEGSDDGLVPGLRLILSVMDASAFRKAAWLVSPNPHFDNRAPIELLREGQRDRVYEEAKAIISG